MEFLTILFRFLIVFIFALLFGIERQRSHKPIGFGTFIFVSTGSCGLAIVAMHLSQENPLPLLGAIITGIGFLGAGALIRTTDKVFGFTSAASIWVFSILGLVIGVGEYFIGFILYSIIIAVVLIDRYLEVKSIGSYQKKLVLVSKKSINNHELLSLILAKVKIYSVEINKTTGLQTYTVYVEGSKKIINDVPKKLYKCDWVESFKIE
jgi:putative Mg2+ transporter-C (MgtC) family protein